MKKSEELEAVEEYRWDTDLGDYVLVKREATEERKSNKCSPF